MSVKASTPQILVPIDFSPHSEAALLFAARLAKCMDALLLIVHIVHDPVESPGYYLKKRKKLLHKLEDAAHEMMVEFLDRIRSDHPDLKALSQAESMLVAGLPVGRILELVDKVHPAMVIMGSQGRTGLAHLALGSKAEQVTRLCPVPVTIVKTPRS